MGYKADLRLRLLGDFEVRLHGTILQEFRLRKADRLLAYLILKGKPVATTKVADVFWPESGSLDSLRQSVHHVRKLLGPSSERLEVRRGFIAFRTDALEADVLDFDRLAKQEDVFSLQQAVDLYTGDLLADWEEEWLKPERQQRRKRYVDILRMLAQAALEAGDSSHALEYLSKSVKLNPYDERMRYDLMNTQVLVGERLAALKSYEVYRDHLKRQGELEPSLEMTTLYRDLKEGIVQTTARSEPPDPANEPIGGAVPLDSAFYVVRQADALFCPAIARQDSLVLVKGPRQSGKSSLLARGLQSARRSGAVTVVTDCASLTPQHLETLDALCLCLAAQLAAQLELNVAPETIWQPLLGPGANLERFLVGHVLKTIPEPVVWALDSADRLFPLPYGSEFFSLLRAWHEKRALEPFRPWRRLTLALACATEAHLYIRDLNKSPFNVGTRVELTDFTPEQVADLNQRYHSPLDTEAALDQFYDLVGGHPYLVRRGLQEMATGKMALTDLMTRAIADDGPFGDHLRRLVQRLHDDPELTAVARDTLSGKPCPPEPFFRLRSAGVFRGDTNGTARPRCRLYAEYLKHRL